jgi:hypothetical protein
VEFINGLIMPILLVLLLFVAFGNIFGINTSRLVSTYSNLVISLLVVIGELLTKLAVPLLKQLGEKIIYASKHYLAEHQKKNPKSLAQNSQSSVPIDIKSAAGQQSPSTNSTIVSESKPKPVTNNPYDDPPEPEIMD